MAEARNAKPGGFKYRTFLVVCTTADCISFISSLACNTVKIANHRGSRFQAAEAVVRPVESVTFHVRLQAGCICWTSSTRGIDAIRYSSRGRKASNRSSCHDQALSHSG